MKEQKKKLRLRKRSPYLHPVPLPPDFWSMVKIVLLTMN